MPLTFLFCSFHFPLQFQGETNIGAVSLGCVQEPAVTKHSVITIPAHGKSTADGMASEASAKVAEGCQFGHHLAPGTRQHVLYLAQMHPAPKAGSKKGLWSPKRYFWGFFDEKLLKPPDHFKPYNNSKQFRHRVGLCKDADTVRLQGPVHIRSRFCACPNCALPVFDFKKCLVRSIVGPYMQTAQCRKLAVHPATTTRSASLAEFNATLKQGDARAVKVADDQRGIEGPFWVVLLRSEMYENEVDVEYPGEKINAGFHVVRVQWFEFAGNVDVGTRDEPNQVRHYRLLRGERLLSTTVLMRLEPVKWLSTRESKKKAYCLPQEEERRIEDSLYL